MNKIKLITNCNDIVPQQVYELYTEYIQQRCLGKPVQYIIGIQEFMGLELSISESVLIPRGDTEIIVEKLLELADRDKTYKIIDMCTGSGAIAVSLGYYLPKATVLAVDISDAALACARRNVEKLDLSARVSVLRSNLFEDLTRETLTNNIDMIVSNPPYIPSEDIHELSVNVKDFEPWLALDGGADGLNFYRRIARDAADYLKAGGILAFEIGYNQGQDVMNILKGTKDYDAIEVFQDLADWDRCVIAHRR